MLNVNVNGRTDCRAYGRKPLLKRCEDASKRNLKSIGVRDGMGGHGQYRVGRGSISCSTTKGQIFGILKNLFKMLFLWVGPKKLIQFDLKIHREQVFQVSLIFD